VLNFLTAFLRVVCTVLFLLAGLGINGTILASLVSGLLVYALSFVPLRDVLRTRALRLPSLKPLFSYSLGATLALGGSTLLTNTDTALAKPFLSAHDAGYYDALATMGRIVLFAGGSLLLVMFPKVATLNQQGRPHRALLAWTMIGVSILSAGTVSLFALFPGQVMTIILHEHIAAGVAQEIVWYGVAMLFLEIASVFVTYFLALGWMSFVPMLFACWVVQVVLLVLWHKNIAQMVTVMVVVMATLLCGIVAFYFWENARSREGNSIRVEGASV